MLMSMFLLIRSHLAGFSLRPWVPLGLIDTVLTWPPFLSSGSHPVPGLGSPYKGAVSVQAVTIPVEKRLHEAMVLQPCSMQQGRVAPLVPDAAKGYFMLVSFYERSIVYVLVLNVCSGRLLPSPWLTVREPFLHVTIPFPSPRPIGHTVSTNSEISTISSLCLNNPTVTLLFPSLPRTG